MTKTMQEDRKECVELELIGQDKYCGTCSCSGCLAEIHEKHEYTLGQIEKALEALNATETHADITEFNTTDSFTKRLLAWHEQHITDHAIWCRYYNCFISDVEEITDGEMHCGMECTGCKEREEV